MQRHIAETVLRVNNLSKVFHLNQDAEGKPFQDGAANEFYAVKDLTFELKKGEICGLIGRNGAGKTTLLELLSGISKPSIGDVVIQGKTASIIDIGAGMHRDLSGLENIFLSGEILGMKRKEIKERLPEIIAFSELKNFLHLPVKHYSSGMFMRLAFSVITHLNADILLIDEVIAVGDLAFSEKTSNRIIEICKQGRSAIIATHSLVFVKACCNSAIYLKNGVLVSKDTIEKVEELYLEDVIENKSLITKEEDNELPKPVKPNHEAHFIEMNEKDSKDISFLWARIEAVGHNRDEFSFEDELKLELQVEIKTPMSFILSVHLNYHYNQPAVCLVPEVIHTTDVAPGPIKFSTMIPSKTMNPGLYTVSVFFVDKEDNLITSYEKMLIFKISLDIHTRETFGYSGKFSGPVFKGGSWMLERL